MNLHLSTFSMAMNACIRVLLCNYTLMMCNFRLERGLINGFIVAVQ
jgi:hypothetical protein